MSTKDSTPPDDNSKEIEDSHQIKIHSCSDNIAKEVGDSHQRRINSYEEKVRRYDRG